ncbi:MAG: sugar phosphate isomerase/epimerase [Chloroflexi bacterium]|nr:sugar phosphate isomerase/epimerase [Chloroflexota bacterium]
MRLGIGSYTYTWSIGVGSQRPEQPMTAMELLERAHDLGVHVVQIADNLPLDRMDGRSLDELVRRAAELEVTIEIGTRGIGREHLIRYVALAERVGSPILRVVVDTATEEPSEDEVVRVLRSLANAFESAGVCLAIENHDRFSAATLVRILDRVGSEYVRICLDTVNSFGALEGPGVVVEALAPRTVNLHVKDFDVVRAAHNMGFVIEGRPAGQGRLDVEWLLRILAKHDRDPNVVLELWTPPEATMAATLAKEDAWARQSVAYLRRFLPA